MWRSLRFVLHCSREQTRESRAESTVKCILAQIREDLRGACKGNRPLQEAVNLILVLAELLLQRTGRWSLGTAGRHSHWDFRRQQQLLVGCIRITEICKFSDFTFGCSLNMGARASLFMGLPSDAAGLIGLSKCIISYGEEEFICAPLFLLWYPHLSVLAPFCTLSSRSKGAYKRSAHTTHHWAENVEGCSLCWGCSIVLRALVWFW